MGCEVYYFSGSYSQSLKRSMNVDQLFSMYHEPKLVIDTIMYKREHPEYTAKIMLDSGAFSHFQQIDSSVAAQITPGLFFHGAHEFPAEKFDPPAFEGVFAHLGNSLVKGLVELFLFGGGVDIVPEFVFPGDGVDRTNGGFNDTADDLSDPLVFKIFKKLFHFRSGGAEHQLVEFLHQRLVIH